MSRRRFIPLVPIPLARIALVLAALAAIAAVLPLARAQRRGAGSGFSHARGLSRAARAYHRRTSAWPYLYPDFYPDYDTTQPYDEPSDPPQFVLMRPPTDDAPQTPKPRPLLIEWRGDHYVRYGGIEAQSGSGNPTQADYSETAGVSRSTPLAAALPQPVLVYRDGRREEIADYTIADGIIYLRSEGWQNGNWTKHVPLSELDMNATLAANKERGARFMLPSAPNVVVASF
jgi:hypothetical protein